MDNILLKLAIVAMILFIIWNIYEMVMAYMFYKKILEKNKKVIDKLIDDAVEEMLGDEDENN